MKGIIPANIIIVSSPVFYKDKYNHLQNNERYSLKMYLGCSDDGSEIVFWTESRQINGQEHRQLKAEKISSNPSKVVKAFNDYLQQLPEQGYLLSGQSAVTVDQVIAFRPRPDND
jgi:hypothetical protein